MPDPARAAVAEVRRPVITEKQLQEAVIQCARLLGYLCYHTHDSRRSEPGFPDLVLVSEYPLRGRLIFAEIKAARGRLTHAQSHWVALLRCAGAETHVWYPRDWFDGHIEAVLSGRERAAGAGEESEG